MATGYTVSLPAFIERWKDSAAAERANYQLFLSELCDFLDVPRPEPADRASQGAYVFERPVTFHHSNGQSSAGFIDLYKRGSFILEAKQGSPVPEPVSLFDQPRRAAPASATPRSGTRPCSARAS